MKVQVLVEIEGDDLDCTAIEAAMWTPAVTGKITSVTAIVRNSKGETHMDEYINQQVIKANRCEYANKMGESICDQPRGHDAAHSRVSV